MNLPNHQTPHQISRQGWWGVRRSWLTVTRLRIILAAVAAVLAVLGALLWHAVLAPKPAAEGEPAAPAAATADQVSDQAVSPTGERLLSRDIDGVYVPRGQEHPDLVAVAIDNMVDARPASGLSKASVVIETLAEGGITRFLALFPTDGDVAKIGPVRSARPYFVDWDEEYDAVFAHVGGSPEALDRIDASNLRDANEYFAGAYFWRSQDRKAPHNAYIALDKVRELVAHRWPARATHALTPWKFMRALSVSDQASPDIVIDWSTPGYKVSWHYDAALGQYVRYQNGAAMQDEDGSVVRASTVVVQYAKMSVLDEIGRRRIVTVGNGRALVAVGGKTVEATWERKAPQDRTRFLVGEDEAGFAPGPIWIETVPSAMKVAH